MARSYRYVDSPQVIRFFKFYRSSSQRFFKIPRFKSQQGVKIIYDLVKCGIGHVRCAQAGR
ncbi:hypothetical protein CAMGR0001_2792 [Campylobacter gracilis RM3268]|uniref:Uncharacterized protein n=1 Tax=Campylobacter gracilis RM3268 TaxID=553220 RepID=C8PL01_9BACT|nr:hypothetical protein CAMGR0001_2792 [Campylobacter gracilis RM3268]